MRLRAVAAITLPAAAAIAALAQDGPAPTPAPAKPAGAPAAPRKPVQDAAGLDALRRLAELAPTPGSVGVREVRCSARLTLSSIQMSAQLRWSGPGGPTATIVELPRVVFPPETVQDVESRAKGLVLGAFDFRAIWDPPVVAASDVACERPGDARRLKIRDANSSAAGVLTLGADGLAQTIEPPAKPGGGPSQAIRLTFEKRGSVHVLKKVAGADPAVPSATVDLLYFDAPLRVPMPRAVRFTKTDGSTVDVVYHDVVVDGNLVPGTSAFEAVAGRSRRLDPAARRAFDALDRAIATPYGAGARSMSCRVVYEGASGPYSWRMTWGPEGVTSIDADAAAPGESAYDQGRAWGARSAFSHFEDGMLRPASDEFAPFDAAADTAPGSPPAIVLTPLLPGPIAKTRLQLDPQGRVATMRWSFNDGTPELTKTRTYAAAGAQSLLAEETVTARGTSTVERWSYHRVPGFPPLRHVVEKSGQSGGKTLTARTTFTDWVVDGKPVPSTGAAKPTPAPGK